VRLRTPIGLALAANATPGLAPVVPAVAGMLRIPLTVDSPGVALTFDDGPHAEGTPAVLETLARESAPATFFLAGEQVKREPALTAEISAAGHEVALHCHRHRNQLRLLPAQIDEDMRRGAAAIGEATGMPPRLHRPPYGVYSALGLALARRRYRILLWSRWGHDWRADATPEAIARETTATLGAGDVILLHDADHYSDHDSWRATAAALPRIIETIRAGGLSPVAVP
jgi:peptidoglycan/xylan/chitin deacetylase (PgdA/CDA1 family)